MYAAAVSLHAIEQATKQMYAEHPSSSVSESCMLTIYDFLASVVSQSHSTGHLEASDLAAIVLSQHRNDR